MAAFLLLSCLLPLALAAGEPEDFKAIGDLLNLGVNRSALNRCKLYLTRYPDGPHRAQVAAWGGNLSLRAGRPEEALPLLDEALLTSGPVEDPTSLRLDRAQALLEVGRPSEALEALQGFEPQDEEGQSRLIQLRGKARIALEETRPSPAAPAAIPPWEIGRSGAPAPATSETARPPERHAPPLPRPPAPPTAAGSPPPAAQPPARVVPEVSPAPVPARPSSPAEATLAAPREAPSPERDVLEISPAPVQAKPPSPGEATVTAPREAPSPERLEPEAPAEIIPKAAEPEPSAAPAVPTADPHRVSLDEARALSDAGKDAEAAALLKRLLADKAVGPAVAREARLALGTSLYRLGKYADSLQALAPLTGGRSPDRDALLLAAWDLHRLGRDAEALDLARRASPLTGWKEARALAPVRQGAAERDDDVVIATAQASLSEFPRGVAAVQALLLSSEAWERRGDLPAALRALESALPQMPTGQQQHQEALRAARLSWCGLKDPLRADRWLALAAQSARNDEGRGRVKIFEARMDWERGQSTEALEELAEVTKQYGDTSSMPEAYLLLGQMLSAEGERERSAEAFKVVINSFPRSPAYAEAVLALSESLAAEGRGAEASAYLQGLEGRSLNTQQAGRKERLRGLLLLEQGECGKAAAALGQAAGMGAAEKEEDLFLTLACDVRSGRTDQALEAAGSLKSADLQRAVAFRSAAALAATGKKEAAWRLWSELSDVGGQTGAVALWNLAGGLLAAGRTAEGFAALKRLSSFPPEEPLSVLAQYQLEEALVESGKTADALLSIAAFRRAEPPRAGEAGELLKAARLKTQSGDSAAGAELYQAYLERFPDKPGAEEASLAIAREAAKRGDWAASRKALDRATPSSKKDLLLAQACFKMGDYPAAQEAAERVLAAPLELTPDAYVQASLLAAEAAQTRGRAQEAALYYGQYALYAPATQANQKALLDAAMALQDAGNYDAALEAFVKLQKGSRDPAISFQYAYTLELAGRKEEALAAFLKTAKSPSPMWAPTARYRAAELYAELGKLREAIAIYKDLAASAKGTAQGEFAKRRLQELQAELAAAQGAKPGASVEKPPAKKAPSAKKPASKPKPSAPSKPQGTP